MQSPFTLSPNAFCELDIQFLRKKRDAYTSSIVPSDSIVKN